MSYGKQALQTVLGVIAGAIFLFGFGNAQFAGGSGIQGDPYVIENCTQLQEVTNYLSGYFILS
jgi:hypothetical protein